MLTLSPDERPSVRDVLESERIPLIELEESEFQVNGFYDIISVIIILKSFGNLMVFKQFESAF